MTLYQFYIIVLFLSAALSAVLMVSLIGRRKTVGVAGLLVVLAGDAIWTFFYGLEIAFQSIESKLFAAQMEMIGIVLVPFGLILFALEFTGRSKWLSQTRVLWLSMPAFLTVVMAFTNHMHFQIWKNISMPTGDVFGPLVLQHGLWFYGIWIPYSYILLASATVMLIQIARQPETLYRKQAIIMLVATLFPVAGNILYLSGVVSNIDLTTLAFTFSNIALAIGFARYGLTDILPVAHSQVFKQLGDAVVVIDAKERIVDINPRGKAIFGETSHNLAGKNVRVLLPAWSKNLTNQGDGTEFEFSDTQGKAIYQMETSPLHDRQDRINGYIIILHDITALRRATAEANEANRVKTQLLANISHDLRTPLGAIVGYAEMLQKAMLGPVTEEQQNAASEILDSANTVITFVDNLIGQAEIETGKVVLREQTFNPVEIIHPLLSTLKFNARKRGLSLEFESDANLPESIHGDPYWLRQIMLNLVNNALKFTDTGMVTISFFRADVQHWAIRVQDTGVGIPEAEQKKIFRAFEQSSNTTNRKETGFGLGLSIVSQLTALMKGRIELESHPGKGSTFTVYLPLKF